MKTVKDVCTKDVQYVGPDTPITEIAKLMKDHDCGSILIAENDKLSGVVTDRDIVMRSLAQGKNPMNMAAHDCMTEKVLYCYETDSVKDVLKNMGNNAVRRLPVLNKDKRLAGVVSFADLGAACEDKNIPGEAMEKICKAA